MAADVILVLSCDSWGKAIFLGPRGIILIILIEVH